MTPNTLHNRLAAAVDNHAAACHSNIEIPKELVAGIIPGPARGLYALKAELIEELHELERQMMAVKAIMKAAEETAQQIVIGAYPTTAGRQGFLLGADWTFMPYGPEEQKQHEERERRKAASLIEQERQRRANGGVLPGEDEPEDAPGLDEIFRKLGLRGGRRMSMSD